MGGITWKEPSPDLLSGLRFEETMLQDPFGDPFRLGTGPSLSEIFRRRGGGVRIRKPEAGTDEEAEPAPTTASDPAEKASDEPSGDKVVLKNPKWDIEKVGFNEETDISVEAVLPESQSHKTKVEFELFAKTPEGVESISKGQGHIERGRAKARIPVYIPKYRDEEGNLLPMVEFFFSAKHSQSDLCKDEKAAKVIDGMADHLIESHILPDLTFATGKSFLHPRQAEALKSLVGRIKEWKSRHPEGKLSVFGHADAVGKEEPNKKLLPAHCGRTPVFSFTMIPGSPCARMRWGTL